MTLRELFKQVDQHLDKEVEIKGWIRRHRKQKEFGFIDFSDGTCFKHMQVVYDKETSDFDKQPSLIILDFLHYNFLNRMQLKLLYIHDL